MSHVSSLSSSSSSNSSTPLLQNSQPHSSYHATDSKHPTPPSSRSSSFIEIEAEFPSRTSYNPFEKNLRKLTMSKLQREDSVKATNMKMETAQLLMGGLVTAINVFGFPVGKLGNPLVKAYIVSDVSWKVWSAFSYIRGCIKDWSDIKETHASIPTSVGWGYALKRVTEMGVAVCSQIPAFLKVPKAESFGGITALAGEAFFRMESIRLACKSVKRFWNWKTKGYWGDSAEADHIACQKLFTEAIRRQRDNFYASNERVRLNFINQLEELREEPNEGTRIERFIDLMTGVSEKQIPFQTSYVPQPLSTFTKIEKKAVPLIVAYPVAGLCFENWMACRKVLQWPTLPSAFFAATPVSAMYLAVKCARSVISQFKLMFAFYKKQNLFSDLVSRKKFYTLKVGSLLVCLAGAVGMVQSGDCDAYQTFAIPPYFCIPLAGYVFAISFTAINAFIDSGLEKSLLATIGDKRRNQVFMKEDFDAFLSSVQDASAKDLREVMKKFASPYNSAQLRDALQDSHGVVWENDWDASIN